MILDYLICEGKQFSIDLSILVSVWVNEIFNPIGSFFNEITDQKIQFVSHLLALFVTIITLFLAMVRLVRFFKGLIRSKNNKK